MIKKITVSTLILFVFCFTAAMVSVFTMPAYAKSKKITVYPNPWIPESGKSLTSGNDKMRHGAYTADGWIKFRGVNENNDPNAHGDLRIYDITGHLVKHKNWTIEEEDRVPLPQTNQEHLNYRGHVVHWDGKDNDFKYVESGVYIWILREAGVGKYDGKIVVVR